MRCKLPIFGLLGLRVFEPGDPRLRELLKLPPRIFTLFLAQRRKNDVPSNDCRVVFRLCHNAGNGLFGHLIGVYGKLGRRYNGSGQLWIYGCHPEERAELFHGPFEVDLHAPPSACIAAKSASV
jgi:hypothetical protein